MLMLIQCNQCVDHDLKQLRSVRASAIGTLVMRRVGAHLNKLSFDSIGHDLSSNNRVSQHPITVYVNQHRALTTLNHSLTIEYLKTSCLHDEVSLHYFILLFIDSLVFLAVWASCN